MENLTLLIPAKFEKESLHIVLDELKKYQLKIIVILEKEDLETINSISEKDCEILYQNGSGYGDALIYGIQNVRTKFFCIFNADGSFNPRELEAMYNKVKNENFDFVFGSRYMKNASSEDDTIITFIGNKIFTLMSRYLLNIYLNDVLYTHVLCNTQLTKNFNLKQSDFTFCIELPYMVFKFNHKVKSLFSNEKKRISGKKNVNELKDGFLILVFILKCFLNRFFR